jgi:hypothetical protein
MPLFSEHFSPPEYTPQLVEAYANTFIHRQDCYPIQLKDGSYATLKSQLSLELLRQHIEGKITLGAYALNEQSQAHWVCLDADEDDVWGNIRTMAQDLAKKGITPYLEPSHRGGHLWLFTPTLAGKAYAQNIVCLFVRQNTLRYGVSANPQRALVPVQWTPPAVISAGVRAEREFGGCATPQNPLPVDHP